MRHYRTTRAKKNAILIEKLVNERIRNSVSARDGNVILVGREYDAAYAYLQVDPIRYMDMIDDVAEELGIPRDKIDWDHFPRPEWYAPFGWH